MFEAKHACFGGTAGLLAALDWIAAGSARGRKALIVCTDIARYGLSTPGEPTQGAGAVAILVSENPRLLALEVGVTGSYAQDVNDFWRPLYSKEAVVDGHHSVQCYLDALAGAYKGWQEPSASDGHQRELARRCYHVPYGKMAKKAHRHVMALEGKTEAEADASYNAEVASSLRLPSQVGNIYTGSLVPGAGVAARGARRASSRGSALASSATARAAAPSTSRAACVKGAGAFAESLAAGGAARGSHASTRSPSTSRSACATTEGDQRPVNGEAHELPEGAIAFVGVDADRRIYVA